MTEISLQDVRDAIGAVDIEKRAKAVFMADHDTFASLMLLTYEGGQPVVESPMVKGEPWRIMGYPVYRHLRYEGLSFGPHKSYMCGGCAKYQPRDTDRFGRPNPSYGNCLIRKTGSGPQIRHETDGCIDWVGRS